MLFVEIAGKLKQQEKKMAEAGRVKPEEARCNVQAKEDNNDKSDS